MLRPLFGFPDPISEGDLERELLRKGVNARDGLGLQCVDCGRRPLIGERVFRYGRAAVCALCRGGRKDDPTRSEIVHHLEHGISVRRRAA